MAKADIYDYGQDDKGAKVIAPFSNESFAKSRSVEQEPTFGGTQIYQVFNHWTMYDYFKAIALIIRGAEWNDTFGACNLLGIREMDLHYRKKPRVQGEFNDLIVVVRENVEPEIYLYQATIDPGGSVKPNKSGQLILENGIHRVKLGKRNKAINKKGAGTPVMILVDHAYKRDKNMDGEGESNVKAGSEDEAVQIHWSSSTTEKVGGYSAGCSVIKSDLNGADWQEFIGLMKECAGTFDSFVPPTEDPKPTKGQKAESDLYYLVSSSMEFLTPAEIFKKEDFYNLLSNLTAKP
jgi:hypothetical protein